MLVPGSLPATLERRQQPRGPALPSRLLAVALAAGWLVYEWHRWPNGSPLLGPLGLVWYNGPGPGNLTWFVVGLLLVLAYPIRPGALTAVVSVLGILFWVFIGLVAQSIGC